MRCRVLEHKHNFVDVRIVKASRVMTSYFDHPWRKPGLQIKKMKVGLIGLILALYKISMTQREFTYSEEWFCHSVSCPKLRR